MITKAGHFDRQALKIEPFDWGLNGRFPFYVARETGMMNPYYNRLGAKARVLLAKLYQDDLW